LPRRIRIRTLNPIQIQNQNQNLPNLIPNLSRRFLNRFQNWCYCFRNYSERGSS
jgi:hypothetical protein